MVRSRRHPVRLALIVTLATFVGTTWSLPASASTNPDMRRVVFVRNGDIFSVSAQTGAVRRLTFTGNNGQPEWSPASTRIAFVSRRDGDDEIFTMNPDGSGIRKLTWNTRKDADPSWSPDGTRIAFVRDYRFARPGYCDTPCETGWAPWTMAANGTSQRRISVQGGAVGGSFEEILNVTWSPDGRFLAGVGIEYALTQDYGVYVFDLAGRIQSLLYSAYTAPSWATDGNVVACSLDGLFTWVPTGDPSVPLADVECSFASMSGGRRFVAYIAGGVLRGRGVPSGADVPLAIVRYGPVATSSWSGSPYDWSPSGRLIAVATPDGIRIVAPDDSYTRLLPVRGTDPTW
jgi:dipeptidyl aminopeptidase/acylaminoacyl peptidase